MHDWKAVLGILRGALALQTDASFLFSVGPPRTAGIYARYNY